MSSKFVQPTIFLTLITIILLTLCHLSVTQILFDDAILFEDAVRSEFDTELAEIVNIEQHQSPEFEEKDVTILEEEQEGTAPLVMTMVETVNNNESTCAVVDALTCCLTAVGLPCSQFNNNSYHLNVCGAQCGIPCIDDSAVDDDIGIVIESVDTVTECFDEKPAVCCDYVVKNDLCSANITGMTTGCRKTCQQCSSL